MLSAVEGKGRVYLKTIFLTYSELSCKKKEAQEQMTDVDPIYTQFTSPNLYTSYIQSFTTRALGCEYVTI